jgi:hypothetical protein
MEFLPMGKLVGGMVLGMEEGRGKKKFEKIDTR